MKAQDKRNSDVFLGRQPILNARQEICAFELLFRHNQQQNKAVITSDISATATVITQAFGDFGIEAVLGNFKGFINVDEALLMNELIEFLPKEQVVIEILETIKPTPQILDRCEKLVKKGFTLALDDVTGEDDDYTAFLPYASIIKVDIKDRPWEDIEKLVETLASENKILLAEKVDSKEQAEKCAALGFSLFQGYYFATPTIITGKQVGHSDFAILQLLNLLSSDAELAELESVLKHEPGLSLRLLRTVNSAGYGLASKIDSIRQAITILGRHQLRRWVQLLFYAKLSGGGNSPLLQLATSRGRLMELAASKFKAPTKDFQEKAFMVGIFSLLNVLLSVPMTDILNSISVSPIVCDALESRSGSLGRLLLWVESLEKNEPNIVPPFELKHLPDEEIAMLIVDTFRWTTQWISHLDSASEIEDSE